MIEEPQAELDRIVKSVDTNVASLSKQLKQLRSKAAELAERKWAVTLDGGAQRLRTQLEASKKGGDVVAALELSRALKDVYLRDISDDLVAELAEVPAERAKVADTLRELERLADEGLVLSEALHQASVDVVQAHQERTMQTDRDSEAVTTTIRKMVDTLPSREFLADVLSSMTASNAALAAPANRSSSVGAQLSRTLDALGLPHSGNTLSLEARREDTRTLLIDALKRGYGFRDHDGVRTYYRVDRVPISAKPSRSGAPGPALRGLGLVQVEMLRAQASLVLQLLGELPSMLPYTPLRVAYDAQQLLDRIRTNLDDILALASAPLGPTPGQGESRFRRLVLAVADWLERGGITACSDLRRGAAQPRIEDLLNTLERNAQCAVPGGAILTREIDLRIEALHEALKAIGRIIATDRKTDSGRWGAEVEQSLTLLHSCAAVLRAELDQFGTSPDEQEVAYFGGQLHPEVSIAQFTGWVEDIAAPFASEGDATPRLRIEELQILAIDLRELVRLASALERHSATYTAELRLVGARRQIKEIGYLLRRARDAVTRVTEDTGYPGNPGNSGKPAGSSTATA